MPRQKATVSGPCRRLALTLAALCFLALPGEALAACPNEAIREEQQATSLPDCRAWEQVSPLDKNNGDVVGDGVTNVAAADGNAIAYASRVSFADSAGSGKAGMTQYIARRGEGGWTTHAITPTPAPGATQLFIGSTIAPLFSEDLGLGLTWSYDLPGVEGDAPGVGNIYREDNASRALTPITVSQADPIGTSDFPGPKPVGVSGDARVFSFLSTTRLLPPAPAGVPNAYEWRNGALHLAGVLPDGSVPAAGSSLAAREDSGGELVSAEYRGAVSADGSHVTFLSLLSGDPQLYVRIDGARTDLVSESESPSFSGEAAEVFFQWMSDDGRYVLFTTSSPLLPEDANAGPDLYLWSETPDPATEPNLTLISDTGNVIGVAAGGGTAVLGASQDASRIYYQIGGASEVLLWDHGAARVVSSDIISSSNEENGIPMLLSAIGQAPGGSRVSRDGSSVAFLTRSTRSNDHKHGLTGTLTNGHLELYVYDVENEALSCPSCPNARGAGADTTVLPHATEATAALFFDEARPRYLSSDGGLVFFSTPESLLPEDTNGVSDVYKYDVEAKRLSLISSGRGTAGAWFVDAGANGEDVFFVTRERLVRRDRDELVDLYDARVKGGFAEPPPPPPPCKDEACQGVLPPPGHPAAASAAFTGPGNPRRHRHRHHRKHTRRHRHRGGAR